MRILLGNNLKFLRRQNDLTQLELATALGISRTKITSYESKSVQPRLHIISLISSYFNISIDELLYDDIAENNKREQSDSTTTAHLMSRISELESVIKKQNALIERLQMKTKVNAPD